MGKSVREPIDFDSFSEIIISDGQKNPDRKVMAEETVFFTETMANVFENQGNWSQAADIYRYLIEKDPKREDLIRKLEAIEGKSRNETDEHLVRIFGTWVDLLGALRKIRRMRAFAKCLQRGQKASLKNGDDDEDLDEK